jgi:toxin ParE1/3/4
VRLVWSEPALAEIADIFSYIGFYNPTAAQKVKLEILFSARKLMDFPEIGRAAERPGVRLLPVSGMPYLLAYRITGDVIEIGSVIDGRMKRPIDLL